MEKTEICRKIIRLENGESRTLVYSLVTQRRDVFCTADRYGADIEIAETGEEAAVNDISTDRDSALRLIDILATGYVTPVSLRDLVYDYLCL